MRQEKGLYVVLFALLLFVLLGLVALAFGLGFIGTNKTKLQNGANLAALAALEKFASLPPTDPYSERANKALERANKIIAANTLTGVAGALGDLRHHGAPDNGGGIVTFGNWYQKKPSPTFNPCVTYPCFVPNDPPGGVGEPAPPMNAVRVEAHNQSGNELLFRLGRFLGKESFILASSAIATVVPRCTAYLMDVSESAFFETHSRLNFNEINVISVNSCIDAAGNCPDPDCLPGCIADEPGCYPGCNPYLTVNLSLAPENFGLGAYLHRPDDFTPGHAGCAVEDYYYDSTNIGRQKKYWCNTPHNPPEEHRPSEPLSGGFRHYQSDYELEEMDLPGSGTDSVWVDKLYVGQGMDDPDPIYDGPQPFTRNFLAFNAALRQVQSTSVGGDLSYIVAFTGILRNSVPETGLTSNLGHLIQLTNLNNRGKRYWNGDPVLWAPEIHPNFVDMGWAPYPGNGYDSTSGIGNAVYFAAERLHSECPASSRKSILLASDGLTNTHFSEIPNPNGFNHYGNYVVAVDQLLNSPIPYSGGEPKPPILQLLKEYEISFSMILDGGHVGPNFLNVASGLCGDASSWSVGSGFGTNDPKCYFNLQEAYAHGYGGKRAASPLFDWGIYDAGGSPMDPTAAYMAAGTEPGVRFGDPIGVWSDVALETGGYFCPLLTRGNVANYVDFADDRGEAACDAPCPEGVNCSPCVLKSEWRNPNPGANVQTFATEYLRKGEQAAQCARLAVGLNPFTLVE